FGDAELAAMIAPRHLVVEASKGPEVKLPSEGGAPARLTSPPPLAAHAEMQRAMKLVGDKGPAPIEVVRDERPDGGEYGRDVTLRSFLVRLGVGEPRLAPGKAPESKRSVFDTKARQARQVLEVDRHTQRVLEESPYTRQTFMSK